MDWTRVKELMVMNDAEQADRAVAELTELLTQTAHEEDRAAILLSIATCLRNLGRSAEARGYVREACDLANKSSEVYAWALFGGAGLDVDEGNWQGALEKLDDMLARFSTLVDRPENRDTLDDVRRMRGIALLGINRPKAARPLLEVAATKDREKELVMYCLGKCYYKLGEFERATKCLKQTLSRGLATDYQADAHYHLGLSYYRLNKLAWAIQEFEWCLEHDGHSGVSKDYIIRAKALAEKDLADAG